MLPAQFPLADFADRLLAQLYAATCAGALADLDGTTLLGERASLGGMFIPGRISAGGGCRLFDSTVGSLALNLARPADRDLLPALFESADLDVDDHDAIAALIGCGDPLKLVARGRSMGLALASEDEVLPAPPIPCHELSAGPPASRARHASPRILDLSALWAGPLASHLLWLAGAEVIKVESRDRPDGMRLGSERFHALLNQGKASVALTLSDPGDRQALLALIAAADIVIESSRPRALLQFGIDAAQIVSTTPGLVWLSITGHGAEGGAENWVGFGDDCGVAGGLTAALRDATGRCGFVGDAVGDPLTGMLAAVVAYDAWRSGRGGRHALAMSHVVAHGLDFSRRSNPAGLLTSLRAWRAAEGRRFPPVSARPIGPVARFGEHTRSCLEQLTRQQSGD
jgi:hypothetical protein